MPGAPASADDPALEQFRDYLRMFASQQLAARYRGKVDPSGIVQETLFEAHREIERGQTIPQGERLAWLRRILANNLADEVRRFTADKRDVGREVSLEHSVEQSSQRLEAWLACDLPSSSALEREEQVLAMARALARLPELQRDALILHFWTGWKIAEVAGELGRSRDAVGGLIRRGLKQLRFDLGVANGASGVEARHGE